jgi:hypothetical protein
MNWKFCKAGMELSLATLIVAGKGSNQEVEGGLSGLNPFCGWDDGENINSPISYE